MAIRILPLAMAVAALVSTAGANEPAVPAKIEATSGDVQQAYAHLELVPQSHAQQPLLQTQFAEQPYLVQPPVDQPLVQPPYYGEPTHIIPPAGAPVPPPSCEICGSSDACQCDVRWRRSGWKLAFELYGLQSHVTDAAFGPWPNDGGGAAQISLGYEWMSGFGIRANSWGFSEDARLPGPDVELTMGTFQLDFYKAIVSGHGELVLGAGPTGGRLEFRVPSLNDQTEFHGGGASVFVEGYYPFYRRPRWEVAFVGETRMSLLAGDWRDNGGGIVDDTDGDSMAVWEIGFGLEYRHRFGQHGDHYWFVQGMPEYQQWTSEWMGDQLGSSVALTGANLNFGLAW
jgi:hypothetical protein